MTCRDREVADGRDPVGLDVGVGDGDLRVDAGGRAGDRVDRHLRRGQSGVVGLLELEVCVEVGLERVARDRGVGSEVRERRARRRCTRSASRGAPGSTPDPAPAPACRSCRARACRSCRSPAWRTAGRSAASRPRWPLRVIKRAVRAAGEDDLRDAGHRERVDQAEQDRQNDDDRDDGGA